MLRVGLQFEQANHPPGDGIPCFIPHQLHDDLPQHARILPAPDNRQLESQAQRPHYIDRPHSLPPPPACPAIPYDLGVYGDVPFPVENVAIEDQAQRLDEAHYNEPPPAPAHLAVPYDLGVNDYARPVQNVQAQAQVFGHPAPEIRGNYIFPYAPQHAEAGPCPTFPGVWPYQAPPSARQVEGLRHLASRYFHHPNSQVEMIRMEQDPAGRPRVVTVIILGMDDFI